MLPLARRCTRCAADSDGDSGNAYNFNSLDLREWETRYGRAENIFDVVLTNPPFGSKIGISSEEILARFDFGRTWVRSGAGWVQTDSLAQVREPQILFLELCVRLLKPGGRLGIVLPEGVFGNKGSSFVWQWLRERGTITGLLDCPRTTFQPGTDTKTNVLFFEKVPDSGSSGTRVAVALRCGHDRRGRTMRADGTKYEDDFVRLGRSFHRNKSEWREVELAGTDYLVPRYYEEPGVSSPSEAALLEGASYATLGDLLRDGRVSIRKGHEPGSEAYGTGDVPFVRTSDISNFEINADPTKSVSEEVYEAFRQSQNLRAGDVLMVVDGRYRIGASALLTGRTARCVVQSHIRILSVTPEDKALDSYSLLYALSLPSVRRRIRDLVFVQSTLGTLGNRIQELRIPLLGLPGVWSAAISEFQEVLVERDRLLGRLKDNAVEAYEL